MLAVLLLLPLAACATKADVRDLQGEIRELNARQEALMRELQAEQRMQRDSIRMVADQLGEHRIQFVRTLRDMEEHLIQFRELMGVSQQELAALRDQMNRRQVPEPAARTPERADPGGEATEIYQQALSQLRRESLTAARFGFEDVVERFPNHEITPSARYFLAEILVRRDELDEAIEAFLLIPQFHPAADRVPEALYRVAIIHRDRGETDEARAYLERVVNSWSDHPIAEDAERALRELR